MNRLVLIAILLLPSMLARAGASAMPFQPLFKDIAPGEIQEFLHDEDGYIWVGARNSLLRYNAYEFQQVFYEQDLNGQVERKAPHFTTEIFQDSTGQIWVSSHSGLFLFDQDLEVLKRVRATNGAETPLYSENTHDITELPTGDFIVGLNDGFAIIEKKTLIAKRFLISDYVQGFTENTVFQIVIDDKKRVWFGARTGLFEYDYQNQKLEHFIPDPENPKSQVDNSLWSLGVDRDGNIWGGTLGAGLYIFDPEAERFERLRSGQTNSRGLPEDTIWHIMKDSKGAMWLSHDRNGISHYNPQKQMFERYTYELGQVGSLIYNSVRTIMEDRDGNYWVGHYPGGISFYDRSSEAIRVYRQSNQPEVSIGNPNILAVMEDRVGNFWLAVGDGVDYFDRDSGRFKHYRKSSGTYPASGTLSGHIDHKGQVWIGTWTEGYHKYNPDKDLFEAQPVEASLAGSEQSQHPILNDATIWGFCETKDKYLWIATHYAGINRYSYSKKMFTKFKNQNTNDSLANNIAWSCFEDSKGRFWVGTAWGLSLMDRESKTFKSYRPQAGVPNQLPSGSVMAIYEDQLGQLWVGTDGGLLLYREKTDDFRVFTTRDGLANQGIRAITGDADGNLWVGTNSGIVRLDTKTYQVKNYLEHGGQAFSGVNTGAALTTKKGEVVFGTVEGLIVINPRKMSNNSRPPPIVFTEFNVFTKPVLVNGPDNLLKSVIGKTSGITLDYTQKMFSLEFSALAFRSPSNNQYAYKLEGFDQEWREIGAERSAQYTNLSSGHYVFRVRASNNDGVWNTHGPSIDIHQLPPPWQTWWAYLIYSLSILALIVYFIHSQKRKRLLVEEQNRILEIKVAERTADLAQKNKDIQSMLSNMRQGLFTIEESGEIHHEYSVYLESIFETKAIAGVDAIKLLFSDALIDNDILDQVEVCLCSIIGMDEMNYEMNSHLLLNEYQKTIQGKNKVLSLDWSPIVDDDIVTKLMVSVRDITEMKALEKEAEGKKRELDIIGQLLSLEDKKYSSFMITSREYLKECYPLVRERSSLNEDDLSHLFRNMHTIKGNSRTHGFTYIANMAHNAESTYASMKSGELQCDSARLLEELEAVQQALEDYDSIYTGALGRSKETPSEERGIWLPNAIFESVQAVVEKLKPYDEGAYATVHHALNSCLGADIEKVLSSQIKVLAGISDELGKHHPNVIVKGHDVLVKERAHSLLGDVFSHLLRNSIDHGIESPKQRLEKGKNAHGTIEIELCSVPTQVEIRLSDDGRGIDIKRLFIKGVERGVWNEGATVRLSDIAELMFSSGMSTKESVTEISGRGVGMDAVKQFLLGVGGDIRLELDSSSEFYEYSLGEVFVRFAICVVLPKDYFIVS